MLSHPVTVEHERFMVKGSSTKNLIILLVTGIPAVPKSINISGLKALKSFKHLKVSTFQTLPSSHPSVYPALLHLLPPSNLGFPTSAGVPMERRKASNSVEWETWNPFPINAPHRNSIPNFWSMPQGPSHAASGPKKGESSGLWCGEKYPVVPGSSRYVKFPAFW